MLLVAEMTQAVPKAGGEDEAGEGSIAGEEGDTGEEGDDAPYDLDMIGDYGLDYGEEGDYGMEGDAGEEGDDAPYDLGFEAGLDAADAVEADESADENDVDNEQPSVLYALYDALYALGYEAGYEYEYETTPPGIEKRGKEACRSGQFACGEDGSPRRACVSTDWICDGDNDCGNMADEQDCPAPGCDSYMFTCSNGICTNNAWVCDGTDDCGDSSDEQNCTE